MNLKLKFKAVLLILMSLAFNASGQDYHFRHFQAENGLSHNTVFSVMQDRKGFIWVGTKSGINRFDGYRFKGINENNSYESLTNTSINSICEDRNGTIWIATGHGLFQYDSVKEVLTKLSISPQLDVNFVKCDSQNNLWLISRESLFKYNIKDKKLTFFGLDATSFSFDNSENLWLGTKNGFLKKLEVKTNMVANFEVFSTKISAELKKINKVCFTGKQVLIGTMKLGLLSFDINTTKTKYILAKNKNGTEIYVRDILATAGNVWIATESGIFLYHQGSEKIVNFKKSANDSYSISDNAVYALYEDRESGIWAGTYFGGLNYFSKETSKFEKYYPVTGENSISGSAVREIHSVNGKDIWIGTEDAGLNKFNPLTHHFSHYTTDGKANSISYPNIHGLFVDQDKLFVGPYLHGLEVLSTSNGKVLQKYNPIKTGDGGIVDFVMSIYKTTAKKILIGTMSSGILEFNESTNKFKRATYFPTDAHIFAIAEDHDGYIWTGSFARGAFFYQPKSQHKGNVKFLGRKENTGQTDFLIQGILEDSNHRMWFATEGGGLICLEKDRKTFKKFTTKSGFPTNNIYRMLEDNFGQLWISSLKGLICLDLKTEKFKVYTQANGLTTDQFNYNSAYKSPDGKMYFGSVKGLIAFYPSSFNKKQHSPVTYFTDFQIDNHDVVPNDSSAVLKKSITYTDTIILNYDQANFNIEFAALSYSAPSVTNYKYKMVGLDKNYTYLTSNRKAYFTDLSAGSYVFTVVAESNVGAWTSRQKTLFIKVLPPFWKSTLAYIVYAISLLVAIYYAIKYYQFSIEKKNSRILQLFELEKEREVYQAKIEFFTTIAHEIQTPLTLIKGPTERALKKIAEVPSIRKNLLMIEKNANRLLELTSQLLDFRKAEINQYGLNYVKVNISLLLKEQISFFEHEAERKKIVILSELPKNAFHAFIDREAMIKIIGNLLSNAIKYADRLVEIKLASKEENQRFTIQFINDGTVISFSDREKIFKPFFRAANSKDKPGTGIGLSLAKSLADLHNGSLRLLDTDEGLTIFELSLPVHQEFEFVLGK